MKKITAIVVAFGLLAAACGSSGGSAADPASIDSCEGIADATISVMQDVIDSVGDLDAAEIAALGAGGELPSEISDLQQSGEDLAARAQELNCTNLGELLASRVDELEVADDNIIGSFIKDALSSGDEDVFSRLSP